MKKIFLLLLTFITVFPLWAQKEDLNQIFEDKREICFFFDMAGEMDLSKIGNIISIDNVSNNKVHAYANKQEFERFLELNIPFYLSPSPAQLATGIVMKDEVDLATLQVWDFYPTYDEYIEIMENFATTYPDLCEIIEIGESTEGRKLLAAHINNDLDQVGEPEFFYTSTMHGDETAGYIVMIALIDHLLSNYGAIDQVTNLVDNLDIYINPNANPDGTYAGGNSTVQGATRSNANGVDLNRNYPDPQDGPHPDGNEWQAETIALMDFAENHDFVMSANFHGGAEVVNYPWDTWPDLHADDLWYQMVSHEYADTCQEYSPNGYISGFNDGITNGYAWYTTNGCRQDYMNYFQHCREVTIEISNTKLIPASELDDHWEYNRRSLLNYMNQSLYGIKGTVTDLLTGEPVEAIVYVNDHDLLESQVESHAITGEYYRPILAGTYDLTFQAPGYMPLVINGVEVSDYEVITVNAQMDAGTLTADFIADKTFVAAGTEVSFTDLSYGNPVSWEWTFENGDPATSTAQNPVVTWNDEGTFDVSLTVYDADGNYHVTNKAEYITVSLEYIMNTSDVTTCGGIFYDSGNADNNYSDNEDYTMTFYPGEDDKVIECEFLSFDVEYHASCDYDYMKIYNGIDESAPLIGTYCGTNSPGTVTADNEAGALTFVFHSDYSQTGAGWEAAVSCKSPVGIAENSISNLKVYPNPAEESIITIEHAVAISNVFISDLTGRVVENLSGKSNSVEMDISSLESGVYLVSVLDEAGNSFVEKLIIR
jgi:PKD repeat protein